MKICVVCKIEKSFDDFKLMRHRVDKHKSKCAECEDKARKYYLKRYFQKNGVREKHLEKCKQYNQRPEVKQRVKDYNKRDDIKRAKNKYCYDRYKSDFQFKLAKSLRNRLNGALKGNYRFGSAVDDLGCSIDYLKQYLESLFQYGMTWKNWNQRGWHIDHKIPLSKFDLTDPIQFKKACHYSNLQPLWAVDNLRKGSKIL